MLSLTKKTEYALIAMCHLARAGAGVVSAREIAVQHRVKLPLLMNVLKLLNRRGLLCSARGARGGYRLAVPPGELTLAQLVEVVEGPVRLMQCAPRGGAGEARNCELLSSCPVRQPLMRVHEYLERFLRTVTVSDLAFDETYGMSGSPGGNGSESEAVEPLRVLAR